MSRRSNRNQESQPVEADAALADELVEKNVVPASDELVPESARGEEQEDAENTGNRSGDAEADRAGKQPGGTVTNVNYANFNGASSEVDLD